MKSLQPIPQCIDCLVGLAQMAAGLISQDDKMLQIRASAAAHRILDKARKREMTSPEIANHILREILAFAGVPDPYAGFRAKEMELAREIFRQVEYHQGDDLRSRIDLAVLGNSLDFFKEPEKALADVPRQLREGLRFFRDDISCLEDFLSAGPELVLYLADNAGEIYFDYPLFEQLRERAHRTVLVVKGGPSLNDLTRADLRLSRLEDRFPEVVDTGTEGVGIEWGRLSKEFLDLLDNADLVISKGMANFETIYPRDLRTPVFFLFRAKCQPMQDYLKAPADSLLALWHNGGNWLNNLP
ncbi:MAG: ARMT1-like domain-containing protein [Pseudomonadota bacterium]